MSTEDGNYDLSGSDNNSFNYGNGQFILDPNSKQYEFVTRDPGVITYTDPVTGVVSASGGNGVGLTGATTGTTNWSNIASKILGAAATPAGIAGLATSLYGMLGGNKPSTSPGWHGVINPQATEAIQTQIAQPAYVPYSGQAVMGRRQLSDMAYSPKVAPVAGAPAPAPEPFVGGYSTTPPAAAVAPVPMARTDTTPNVRTPETPADRAKAFADYKTNTTLAAEGGLMGLAHGGSTGQPRYLKGHTDGMADKIDTDIDGRQAAKLSHGEFVVPADVVSHLGNGNSDAGADVLYKMMDRVRRARTGNPKQGKQIKPEKFVPGGLASLPAYAEGGAVAFDTGGPILPTTQESNLSSWAGPGVADYIARGTALSQNPYQAYTGPLTAGTSPLQQASYNNAGNINVPTTSMGAYTPGTFDTATAQRYMNPYIQSALDPQIAEARRQSQITQMGNNAQAVKAGAFGGSRGALMNTETQRNLGTNLANITGQGYNTAYNNAQGQYNTEVGQQQTAQNQNNQFGLSAIAAQAGLGATQRANEQEGITALLNQFNTEQADPMKKVQFEQSLYQGLPVSTVTGSTATTGMQQAGQAIGQGQDLAAAINKFLGPS
jgi:hypothetical protein